MIPPATDILEVVSDFLRKDCLPLLDTEPALQMRIAINALDLVRRELTDRPDMDELEKEGLEKILASSGPLQSLRHRLSSAIRTGAIRHDSEDLRDFLWGAAVRDMAVNQPKYPPYVQALRRMEMRREE